MQGKSAGLMAFIYPLDIPQPAEIDLDELGNCSVFPLLDQLLEQAEQMWYDSNPIQQASARQVTMADHSSNEDQSAKASDTASLNTDESALPDGPGGRDAKKLATKSQVQLDHITAILKQKFPSVPNPAAHNVLVSPAVGFEAISRNKYKIASKALKQLWAKAFSGKIPAVFNKGMGYATWDDEQEELKKHVHNRVKMIRESEDHSEYAPQHPMEFNRDAALTPDYFTENILFNDKTYAIACRHQTIKFDVHPWCWKCYVLSGYVPCHGQAEQSCYHCRRSQGASRTKWKSKVTQNNAVENAVSQLSGYRLHKRVCYQFDAILIMAVKYYKELSPVPFSISTCQKLSQKFEMEEKDTATPSKSASKVATTPSSKHPRRTSRTTPKRLKLESDFDLDDYGMSSDDEFRSGAKGGRSKPSRVRLRDTVLTASVTSTDRPRGSRVEISPFVLHTDKIADVARIPKRDLPRSLREFLADGDGVDGIIHGDLILPATLLQVDHEQIELFHPWDKIIKAMLGVGGLRSVIIEPTGEEGFQSCEAGLDDITDTLPHVLSGRYPISLCTVDGAWCAKFCAKGDSEQIPVPVVFLQNGDLIAHIIAGAVQLTTSEFDEPDARPSTSKRPGKLQDNDEVISQSGGQGVTVDENIVDEVIETNTSALNPSGDAGGDAGPPPLTEQEKYELEALEAARRADTALGPCHYSLNLSMMYLSNQHNFPTQGSVYNLHEQLQQMDRLGTEVRPSVVLIAGSHTLTWREVEDAPRSKLNDIIKERMLPNSDELLRYPVNSLDWYYTVAASCQIPGKAEFMYDRTCMLHPQSPVGNVRAVAPEAQQRPFVGPTLHLNRVISNARPLTNTIDLFLERRRIEYEVILGALDVPQLKAHVFVGKSLQINTSDYIAHQTPRLRLQALALPRQDRWEKRLCGRYDRNLAYPVPDMSMAYMEELVRLQAYQVSQREWTLSYAEFRLQYFLRRMRELDLDCYEAMRRAMFEIFNIMFFETMDEYATVAEALSHAVNTRRQGLLSSSSESDVSLIRHALTRSLVNATYLLE